MLRRLCYSADPALRFADQVLSRNRQAYDSWTGLQLFVGATTSKNMLGVVCLISGIFFFWDTVTRWPDRKERRTRRIILVNVAFLAMTLWLLNLANSATSSVCLALGCLVIAAAHSRVFQRHPAFLKVMIPASFLSVPDSGFRLRHERRAWPEPSARTQPSPTEPRYGAFF